MAAQTVPSTATRESLGSLTLYIFPFASVADADTFASGLSTNVRGFWANSATDESTSGDEGANVANSSGTFTFYLKTTGAVTLYVLATT